MPAKLGISDLGDYAPEVTEAMKGGGPSKSALDQMDDLYQTASSQYRDQVSQAEPLKYDQDKTITLSQGKYRGLKVPVEMVKDLYDAAKKSGVDPYLMLGLAGQESTFGKDRRFPAFSRRDVVSGWNLAEQYTPPDTLRYLEQSGAPGIEAKRGFHGYEYSLKDRAKLNEYLEKHPEVMDRYKKLLDTKKLPSDYNSFEAAANFLKKRGIKAYNPGDKNYLNDIKHSTDLLRSDSSLRRLLASF
jgi:hypothetical protein